MNVAELFAGRPDFASKAEVIRFVSNSKNFDPAKEDLSKAEALLIFSTSKQHTWLVATPERLYCVLDDIRKDKLHINWSVPKSRIFAGDRPVISLEARDKTDFTGLLDIGDAHRGWLYLKRLFSEEPVEQRVMSLIESAMGTNSQYSPSE